MKCSLCRHGETVPGFATVTLQRNETTVIVKDVPALVCEECGEYYLDESISQRVADMAEDAVSKHAEVQIIRFAA